MGECWHQRCYLPGIPAAPPRTCSPLQPPASLCTHVNNRELWGLLRLRGRCEWWSTDLQEPSAKPPLSPLPLSANNRQLIYFWLHWVSIAALRLSRVVVSKGFCSLWCSGFSLEWLLLLQSTGSRHSGTVVVAHRLSYPVTCGIFPDQESTPCPLHWQADS